MQSRHKDNIITLRAVPPLPIPMPDIVIIFMPILYVIGFAAFCYFHGDREL